MYMRTSIIITIVLISIQIQAQNVSLAYWGELMTHPGIKASVDYPLLETVKEKTRGNKFISNRHQFIGGTELGFYQHKQNHKGLLIGITSAYRYERKKQREGKNARIFRTDLSIGAGYYRYFLAGTTYQIQDNEIIAQNLGGSNSFMPSAAISFSMNIPNKKGIPLFLYFKPSYYLETKHNTGINHKPFLETGFTYQF